MVAKFSHLLTAPAAGFALLGAIGASVAFGSPATERMVRFFEEDTTMFAEFSQVVLDEGLHVVEESAGLVWIRRPNLFRWEYVSPFMQTIVSDGKTTWIYDVELDQVTVSDAESFVGQTPAEILSGMGTIEQKYDVGDLGRQGRLLWVSIEPKDKSESQFDEMRMAFGQHHLEIVEMIDALGNTTRIKMNDVLKNPDLNARTFEFEIPEGVDVVQAQ